MLWTWIALALLTTALLILGGLVALVISRLGVLESNVAGDRAQLLSVQGTVSELRDTMRTWAALELTVRGWMPAPGETGRVYGTDEDEYRVEMARKGQSGQSDVI